MCPNPGGFDEEFYSNPLEKGKATHSGLENSMGGTVHGVTKSWTRLSDFHSLYSNSSKVGLLTR